MPLTRRGARSVVVTYEVAFSVRIGKLTGEMSAELEERPLDAETAQFTVRNLRTRQGNDAWAPWMDARERTWSAPFLSAQSLLGIAEDSAKIGSELEVRADSADLGETRLPIESVVPLGGRVIVAGLVGQRSTLRGQLAFMLLGARRPCDIEAQFDPYSGRPVRFSLRSAPTANSLDPQVTLTVRATGVGDSL
jgi:hypothetical protein